MSPLSALISACTLFIGLHWIIAGSPLRSPIVNVMGEKTFRILFSLAVLFSLVWMGWAYAHSPYIETWGKADALKPIAEILMAFAFIFLIVGTFSKNISVLNQNQPQDIRASGILRITRNPGLVGFGLWGLAHFMVNGDWAGHLLFGSFLFQGLIGPLNMERKYRNKYGPAWTAFVAQTSHVPFLAILTGKNRLAVSEISKPLLLISIIAFILVLYYHATWFGASPLV
ncbi:MAG TPA: NnrU family protein [Rugosibacter sp.]